MHPPFEAKSSSGKFQIVSLNKRQQATTIAPGSREPAPSDKWNSTFNQKSRNNSIGGTRKQPQGLPVGLAGSSESNLANGSKHHSSKLLQGISITKTMRNQQLI